MSAQTRDMQADIDRAVLAKVRRERNRIIEAVAREFGLDRDRVAQTVTGRFPGSLNEAKA
jgi:hypothetical protein